jgi:putative ABC transport system permease protein
MSVTAVGAGGAEWQDFHERSLERVTALPGVEGAAFAWGVPLTGNAWPFRIEIEGFNPPNPNDAIVALPVRSVTSGYFDMLNQPVIVGRDFRNSDKPDTPQVAIVNETFVERYIDGGNAIGKNVWLRGNEEPPAEIIGVISDSITNDLTGAPEPEVYLPLWQASANSKHLVIRSMLPAEALAGSVRTVLQDIAPTVAIENIKTLDEIRGESLAGRNFAMQLLIGFAVIASVLTLGGVYSVLSLSVAARRREIAIRSAVGAERGRVLGLVMKQGIQMIVVGAAAGVIVSIALSRLLQSWLFGVDAIDPLTLLSATALFVLFALIACWVPARRASAIEPVEALRAE